MSLLLTDAQLNDLFEEIPVLAGRPRQLQELSGGLTNRNVKITTPDGVYVARCTDTSRNFLGIDRDREHYNSKAAEQAGVGAPVIDYRPDLGLLLLGYLNGTTLCLAVPPGTPPDWSANCGHRRAQRGWCSTPPSSMPNSRTRPDSPPATSSAGE